MKAFAIILSLCGQDVLYIAATPEYRTSGSPAYYMAHPEEAEKLISAMEDSISISRTAHVKIEDLTKGICI